MRKRWGWMLTLLKGKHFKVKLLYFKEGGSISMQKHKKRAELWMFIFGRGNFYTKYKDEKVNDMKRGDFIHVPYECWHQFKAKTPSLVLEVQHGKTCSERDIERA